MRQAFIEELTLLAETNLNLFLIVGDLGYSVVEPFAERFPDRFLNAGVAEQNMTGLAAGLASCGFHVFTYSIANFPTLRCLEQIRNDVCYHNLPVTVVSVGGGMAYGNLGYSHHATEDLAVTLPLPNIRVIAPGDPFETRLATRELCKKPGPSYLRLGKAREPTIHAAIDGIKDLRTLQILQEGSDVMLVSTGGILEQVKAAAERLTQSGICAGYSSSPYLKPFDEAGLLSIALKTKIIISVEEHGVGGLSSLISETLHRNNMNTLFRCLKTQTENYKFVGSQKHLRAKHGLDEEHISSFAMTCLADLADAT
ncbi:transketolase C-terminal domain-containing protein [Pelagicoccus sp. SDUM812005]|uniref:transketolase family protein n=1 Tax=Pelagicoccus sp. SDUM812005 TaxID=3041257 RepID=UPI00280D721F|nr:transketolase C-terminal domain-containing protein [Pelagicoccus sp. SDUM812005]MDQ8180931.1 transketolase C-terminal domain-containing protein [Pelagicoccus sp. SDUM812005]